MCECEEDGDDSWLGEPALVSRETGQGLDPFVAAATDSENFLGLGVRRGGPGRVALLSLELVVDSSLSSSESRDLASSFSSPLDLRLLVRPQRSGGGGRMEAVRLGADEQAFFRELLETLEFLAGVS